MVPTQNIENISIFTKTITTNATITIIIYCSVFALPGRNKKNGRRNGGGRRSKKVAATKKNGGGGGGGGGLVTCPGFAGYCSESYPGDTCLVVCAFGRNNVPVCQVSVARHPVPTISVCRRTGPGLMNLAVLSTSRVSLSRYQGPVLESRATALWTFLAASAHLSVPGEIISGQSDDLI